MLKNKECFSQDSLNRGSWIMQADQLIEWIGLIEVGDSRTVVEQIRDILKQID